ncbi:hypothetical protein HBI25_232460 [Parastagonospora nodorum]|nr:hypothetical protein HBI95_225930 [Parastagonospora nodorum]KAH5544062.1 hypothetical protein HBI25_232460 [Parastagonospora nodorum]
MLEVASTVFQYPAIVHNGDTSINLHKSRIEGTNLEETPRWTLKDRNSLEHGLPSDPGRIIYYRDGVSESQYSKVVETEVSAVKRAFVKLRTLKKWKEDIKVTTIVATKRHYARFYPIEKEDKAGKCGNYQPGIVVDTTVTSPYFTEFFLQAHSELQGTTKLADYFVVKDDVNWNVTNLAALAPPAYYADKLCERGRIYLRNFLTGNPSVHGSLRETKTAAEQVRRKMRDAKFKPVKEKAIKVNKFWPRKSTAEEVMEGLHRDQVAKICREEAMKEARKVWKKYVERSRKTPWKATLDGMMF